jgi:hypothetical protein
MDDDTRARAYNARCCTGGSARRSEASLPARAEMSSALMTSVRRPVGRWSRCSAPRPLGPPHEWGTDRGLRSLRRRYITAEHVETILSREGVAQGDPLSMILYGLALLPLAESLWRAEPEGMQPWYADDAVMSGPGPCACSPGMPTMLS